MPRNQDWIPHAEDKLVTLIAVWQTRLTNAASQTAYGWVASECTAVVTTLTAFITARTAYHANRNQGNHDLKEEARKAAIAAMRAFAGRCIRPNIKMNTAQKEELGIIPRDTTPTPVPVPEKGPTNRVETRADLPGMAKVYTAAKPYGVVSTEAAYGVRPARPEDPEDLPRRAVFPHGPGIDRCAHGEHGQPLYPTPRWITHEDPSPWTPVGAGVVIP
jgi:hypothetical protein